MLHSTASEATIEHEVKPKSSLGFIPVAIPLIMAYMITIVLIYILGGEGNSIFSFEGNQYILRYINDPICKVIIFLFLAAWVNCAIQFLSLWNNRLSFQKLLTSIREGSVSEPKPPSLGQRFIRALSGNPDESVSTYDRCFRHESEAVAEKPNISAVSLSYAEFHQERALADLFFLNFSIWVLPIMGFIGTVWGISQAVGGLSEVVALVTGNDQIQAKLSGAMGQVLSGLSTAFDTTFLGLVFAVMVMIPLTLLRRRIYRQALIQNDQLFKVISAYAPERKLSLPQNIMNEVQT